MSAASMAATRMPIRPAGTNLAQEIGHGEQGAVLLSDWSPIVARTSGVTVARAAMPQMPGMTQRHTKKKAVPV